MQSAPTMAAGTPARLDLSELDDLDVLSLYHASGSQDAFRCLYDRHSSHLRDFLRKFLGDRGAAEDVTQETFLKLHTFHEPVPHLQHWLFSVASRLALDRKKHAGRKRRGKAVPMSVLAKGLDSESLDLPDEHAKEPDAITNDREQLSLLWQAIDEGNPDWAKAMRLVYREGLSHSQAADQMGVPLGTLKAWVQRCLASLRPRFTREQARHFFAEVA